MRLLAISLWLIALVSQPVMLMACDYKTLNIFFNGKSSTIKVEVADTLLERKRGLMFRDRLKPNSGMLFVYDSPRKIAFWMKNTSISLDIAFADKSGKVIRVVQATEPFSTELIHGGNRIQYVLEVNAGASRKLNLFKHAELIHQAINPPPINSC